LELEPFREPELPLELEPELRLEPDPELPLELEPERRLDFELLPELDPELPEPEPELRRELELELAAALRRELAPPELRLDPLREPELELRLDPLREPEPLPDFEPLPDVEPLFVLERPLLELVDPLFDFDPLRELEPDPLVDPELRLLSSSSAKIKLLRFVCRGPRLADGQTLHQPLLLQLALLGRQVAIVGVQFQLKQVPLDGRRVVELAIGLLGDLLHNPGDTADWRQREQQQFLEQAHQAAPASSTNECGGSGPV
jgi:hypothetical protein